ncbi:aldo/keto reductase [Aeromicrobium ginsengisoli]|uniref:Aldo/keto reductase n=1 Tax=Aeromicrobium ginsengisoli TaxID=363867 RepID=A0A5M4F919_9ACTN|nr:aldo/keto reductase [Aeromicrobium ginsengisoli]KAA1394267.1 aldo/keto reductase [Aeromicrobium ginsengisoli]
MEHIKVGSSGLEVSPLVLGCMSFGDSSAGGHGWTLSEAASRPFIERALESGITTFDTANVYSGGTGEEILGRALADLAPREDVVIATKLFARTRPGPHGAGLSRTAILSEIDHSLRRLGTDYVDLYQIHRWDPTVPIEETMEALHDVVKAGKVRYLGASSMPAWQLADAQHTAESHGWTRFVAMQDQYNLLQREEEREMHPLCNHFGMGVIPWSPLARGRLARAWDDTSTTRSDHDTIAQGFYRQSDDSNRAITETVAAVAAERGASRAQVALAWVRQQPVVTAPIVGTTSMAQLDDAIASLDLELTADELRRLEEPYTPRLPEGF